MNNSTCKNCGSKDCIYDTDAELIVCVACGLIIDDVEYYNRVAIETDSEGKKESSYTSFKPVSRLKSRKSKYSEVLSSMQEHFNTTKEEYIYIKELLQIYLSDERRIYEYSFTEVVLCIFYLVRLYLKGESLMYYCQLLNADYRKCLLLNQRMKIIFGSKVHIDQSDPLLNLLDKLIGSCYPKLIQKNDWYTELKTATKKSKVHPSSSSNEKKKMDENIDWTLHDQIIIKTNTITMIELFRRHGYFDGKVAGPAITICLAINVLHYKCQYHLKQQPSSSVSLFSIKGFSFSHLNEYSQYNSFTLKTRFSEIISQLVYFGKSLPWVKPSLKRDIHIIYYLDDILTSIEKLEDLLSLSTSPLPSIISSQQQQPTNILDLKRKRQIEEEENENENYTHDRQLYQSSNTLNQKDVNNNNNNKDNDIYSKLPSISILDPISFQKSEQHRKKRKQQIKQIENNQWGDDVEDPLLNNIDQLLKSQKWDPESIIAMSDNELVNQCLRLSSQYPPHFPHGLDQELNDDDISKEELDSYIIP